MKNIAILGSSGSIGVQTLNVVRRYPDRFRVVALTVNSDVETLRRQIAEFHPAYAGICDKTACQNANLPAYVKTLSGDSCLADVAALQEVDLVVVAVVGMCGLKAVMSALRNGKQVALANKESLVSGGRLVMDAAKAIEREILPIDSEHSAVWQCLKSGRKEEVKRIILTASGGSFYGKDDAFLASITPEMAIKHPNWNMGKKISVDSSTMMNKALEIIEARWLFDTKNIDYVVHPQSIVHSMVEYIDGSIIAQLSFPNMELPIQLALTFPDRLPMNSANFQFDRDITFLPPDEQKFPLPTLARSVIEADGTAPCIFNAANEACVQLFLSGKIGFSDIARLIEKTLSEAEILSFPDLDTIYETHREVYGKLMRDYNGFGVI